MQIPAPVRARNPIFKMIDTLVLSISLAYVVRNAGRLARALLAIFSIALRVSARELIFGRGRAALVAFSSMIPKSGNRFSEKIMLKQKAVEPRPDSNKIDSELNATGRTSYGHR